MARDRGHAAIARLLEDARRSVAAALRRIRQTIRFIGPRTRDDLDARARAARCRSRRFWNVGDRIGRVAAPSCGRSGSARKVVELLLDRGADIHAFHSTSRGGGGGWWSTRVQAIDLAIWGWNNLAPSKRDFETARLLVSRGAEFDLTVASALGDIGRVTAILD